MLKLLRGLFVLSLATLPAWRGTAAVWRPVEPFPPALSASFAAPLNRTYPAPGHSVHATATRFSRPASDLNPAGRSCPFLASALVLAATVQADSAYPLLSRPRIHTYPTAQTCNYAYDARLSGDPTYDCSAFELLALFSRAPLGGACGMHLYAFCGNDPVNGVDPLGLAGYFFEGTANHPYEKNLDGTPNDITNVRRLWEAYGDEAVYVFGIGSGYSPSGEPYPVGDRGWTVDREGLTGASMDERVRYAQMALEKNLAKGDKVVDVFGFSRGGASVLEFLNRIQDQIDQGNPLYEGIKMRFVGIFDAVPSKRSEGLNPLHYSNAYTDILGRDREYRFCLPAKMKFAFKPIHAVSLDEQRNEFKVADIKGAFQVGFRGVHFDVGGHTKGNAFDWITLRFMATLAKKAGAKIKMSKIIGQERAIDWTASPSDNSNWKYNDNEDRTLPKRMYLHPSVKFFTTKPENDVSGYPYLPDWFFR